MNRIRELRSAAKMNQVELASKIGISQSTLSYWEIGSYEPDHESLIRLADIFNVSVDYLLGKTENPSFVTWGEIYDNFETWSSLLTSGVRWDYLIKLSLRDLISLSQILTSELSEISDDTPLSDDSVIQIDAQIAYIEKNHPTFWSKYKGAITTVATKGSLVVLISVLFGLATQYAGDAFSPYLSLFQTALFEAVSQVGNSKQPGYGGRVITSKDERDIDKYLEQTLGVLESGQCGLMFDGEPIDDVTREFLSVSLRNSMEMAKKLAKEKYGRKRRVERADEKNN